MEEGKTILNSDARIGSLVRFRYLDKTITENMRRMKTGVGIIVEQTEEFCVISTDKGLFESCWILEVVRSV